MLDEGDYAHVSCIVTKGDMPLSIRWTMHGDAANNVESITTSQAGPRASFLSIASVSHRHRGVYTCHVENRAGKAAASAKLRVNG